MWGLPWQPIPSACTHLPRAPRGSTGGLQQARLEEGVTLHGSHEALLRVRRGPALQREGLTQETLHPPVPGPHDVPLQDPRRGTQHQGCPVRQVWALRSSCTEHEAQKFLEAPGWCRATCQALVYSASVYPVYRHALSLLSPPCISLACARDPAATCHFPLSRSTSVLTSFLSSLPPPPLWTWNLGALCLCRLPLPTRACASHLLKHACRFSVEQGRHLRGGVWRPSGLFLKVGVCHRWLSVAGTH